ncbi:MAG TPA: hypothetical protein VM074_00045 [Solimonas sp.]|nr:hypothetical protein [Solimonas sp.]
MPLPVAGASLELGAARVQGPGWTARDLQLGYDAGSVELRLRQLEGSPLPAPVEHLELRCAKLVSDATLRCAQARLDAGSAKLGELHARLGFDYRNAGRWSMQLAQLGAVLSWDDAAGRYAADKLTLSGSGEIASATGVVRAQLQLGATGGQAYFEPVFNDFAVHPLALAATLQLDRARQLLTLERLHADQRGAGVIDAHGTARWPDWLQSHDLSLALAGGQLAGLVETYLKPFLPGTGFDDLAAQGEAGATLELVDRRVKQASVQVRRGQLAAAKSGATVEGIEAALAWNASANGDSWLSWSGGKLGKLPIGAARLDLAAGGRDLRLIKPVRVPLLDGAVRIERLALGGIAQPGMSAEFAATVEPINLGELCRALGWPEFSGELSGTLPGLRYADKELSLDGELAAKAFDGEVRIRGLRVIEPFGAAPRLAADVTLRNLDLERVTGAFSFGRIEGRLDGDVEQLRVIGWKPVSMRARLYTPPGDDSRHRISQRAIDTISSIGGGPSGILSRGVLRFFDDFSYDRIGWSCVLENRVCRMDGIEPAHKGAGYVLVKGRLLPRIDVIGYTRSVAWDTLVERLKNARSAPAPTVERK